jgi:hypothetical protein
MLRCLCRLDTPVLTDVEPNPAFRFLDLLMVVRVSVDPEVFQEVPSVLIRVVALELVPTTCRSCRPREQESTSLVAVRCEELDGVSVVHLYRSVIERVLEALFFHSSLSSLYPRVLFTLRIELSRTHPFVRAAGLVVGRPSDSLFTVTTFRSRRLVPRGAWVTSTCPVWVTSHSNSPPHSEVKNNYLLPPGDVKP